MLARPDGDILITTIQTKSVLPIRKERETKMYKNRLLQLAVVVVMLMAVAASGVAASSASAANPGVTFKASVSGTAAFTGPTTAVLSGVVNATHMGRGPYSGLVTEITINPDGTGSDVLFEELTAATGDKLFIRCDQVLEEISPGVFRGTDSWEVTGGTGRFNGATGSGGGTTNVDLNAGTFDKELNGTITIPEFN